MRKKSRRHPKQHTNGADVGPIEKAIDAAAEREAPREVVIALSPLPIRLAPNSPPIALTPRSNPNEATILVRGDDGLWHGVILPPGSSFELRPAKPASPIWVPK